ncbi:MAG: hypothetical protein LKG11_01970 [Bacilli bacterium]|jgi:hypothetical protein|nr:hypothetical protein [Bacilli bacterium]
MIRATKISLAALACLALAGCGSNVETGVATPDDFVSLSNLDSVHISALTLKTKSSSIAADASGLKKAGPRFASYSISAHEVDFFTNDDFEYSTSSLSVVGHSDVAHSSYYLVNGTTSFGYVYDSAAALTAHREAADRMLVDDYAYIASIYDTIKQYSGETAEEAGFASLSVLYTNVDSTVGYNCVTVVSGSDGSSTETDYFLTLDKVGDAYVFTDVIVRAKTTSVTGGITYSNYEFNLVHKDGFEDQVFNLASMYISKAGLDLSSIPATSIDSPAI